MPNTDQPRVTPASQAAAPTDISVARRRRLGTHGERRDVHVRIGEVKASADPAESLVAIGLGSCLGVCITDRSLGAMAVAHVFLPASEGRQLEGVARGRFADTAVPAMLELLAALGATRATRLSAVLVGGARLFTLNGGAGMDVGERNIEAVHGVLREHGIRVVGELTGGTRGRTLRAYPGECAVTAQAIDENEHVVWPVAQQGAA
jgi:chemotaxis protein CheD